jgi:hypothetical protein
LTVVVLWLVAGLALLVALLAAASWELRYEFTRLRSQVARIDPGEPEEEAAPPQSTAAVTFVPLSSMKKKNG